MNQPHVIFFFSFYHYLYSTCYQFLIIIKSNLLQICGMTGREYTYEMAHSMSKKFGSALKRLGAKKGDCLCMVVPNIPEFPIAFFGAAGVGVTLTTMNPTYRPGN